VREHRGLSRSGRLLGVLLADDVGGYCGAGEDRQEGDDETVANAVHAVTFREWKLVPFDRQSVQVAGAGNCARTLRCRLPNKSTDGGDLFTRG